MLDEIKLLIEDFTNNLGWRIVLKFTLPEDKFVSLLKETNENPDKILFELIDDETKRKFKRILQTLRSIQAGRKVKDENLSNLLEAIRFDQKSTIENEIKNQLESNGQKAGNAAIKKIPIKVTTIQSSKGLSGDFVFITHLDDQYYFESKDKSIITVISILLNICCKTYKNTGYLFRFFALN